MYFHHRICSVLRCLNFHLWEGLGKELQSFLCVTERLSYHLAVELLGVDVY